MEAPRPEDDEGTRRDRREELLAALAEHIQETGDPNDLVDLDIDVDDVLGGMTDDQLESMRAGAQEEEEEGDALMRARMLLQLREGASTPSGLVGSDEEEEAGGGVDNPETATATAEAEEDGDSATAEANAATTGAAADAGEAHAADANADAAAMAEALWSAVEEEAEAEADEAVMALAEEGEEEEEEEEEGTVVEGGASAAPVADIPAPSSSAAAAAASARPLPLFPPLLNTDSAPVIFGSSCSDTLYCGRNLGRDAIPGSDGRCGPDDGPQCPGCRSMQYDLGGRVEALRRAVPGMEFYTEKEEAKVKEEAEKKKAAAAAKGEEAGEEGEAGGGAEEPEGEKKLADPSYAKYFKMLRVGLPMDAVRNALRRDGRDEDVDMDVVMGGLGCIPEIMEEGGAEKEEGEEEKPSEEEETEMEKEDGKSEAKDMDMEQDEDDSKEERKCPPAATSEAGGSVPTPGAGPLNPAARAVLVGALRLSGGAVDAAAKLVRDRTDGSVRAIVPPSLALPPLPSAPGGDGGGGGGPTGPAPVSETDARTLVETLGLDLARARSALRRQSGDVQRAAAFALDEPDNLDAAVVSDAEEEERAREEEREGQRRRDEALGEAVHGTVFDEECVGKLMELRGRCTQFEREAVGESYVVDGHRMVCVRAGCGGGQLQQQHCRLCAGAVPSPESGSYACELCHLCEGCVRSPPPQPEGEDDTADTEETGNARRGAVFRCPALRNGSHLHVHPLTYGLERRRNCHCDIGSGCGDVLWSCAECDFDVCAVCASRPAPVGYDRLSGTTIAGSGTAAGGDGSDSDDDDDDGSNSGDEDSDADSDGDDSDDDDDGGDRSSSSTADRIGSRPFDAVDAERRSAARWEAASAVDPPPGMVVVGTGEACGGGSSVVTHPAAERRKHADRREARRKLRGEAAGAGGGGGAETKLTEDAEEALELFRKKKAVAKGELGSGAGAAAAAAAAASSLSASSVLSPPSSSSSGKAAAGVAAVVSAAELAHAEDMLHRARAVSSDPLVHRELCRAVAFGRLDLAGSLLLSEAFAPVPEEAEEKKTENCSSGGDGNEGEVDEDKAEECWCGLPIDSKSAPDGSVGCLGGHAMHPSCASDLLLSGGTCPECRMHLFFPRVPDVEARSATELVEAELRRSRMEEDDDKEDGGNRTLAVDDFVRIASDPKVCEGSQMSEPRSGGWSDDMTESCGKVGRITELVREEVVGGTATEEGEEGAAAPTANGDSGGTTASSTAEGRVVAAKVRTRGLEHTLEPIRRGSDYQCKNCSMYGPSPETGRRKCSRCQRCERCCSRTREDRFCPRTSFEWTWSPALLRKTCPDWTDTALLDPEEAAARDAEGHVMKLRAELKAVAAARERLKAKTEAWAKLGEANSAGGSGEKVPPQLQLAESSACFLGEESTNALCHLWGTVSASDWAWARHLLTLAQLWDEGSSCGSSSVKPMLDLLNRSIREGDIDSVARAVRRRNALLTAERLRWDDALRPTAEYVVSPTAAVDLRAFPSTSGPRTGFRLHPEARFRSRREVMDGEGNVWIQVDPKSFLSAQPGEDNNKNPRVVVADLSDQMTSRALVGVRVRRGPDWKWDDQDGGDGNVGVIVHVVRSGKVSVRWGEGTNPKQYEYRAGGGSTGKKGGHHDLVFAGASPQPPQGWLCVRPAGAGTPAVCWRSRSALRCFCCGDGLMPPRPEQGRYKSARGVEEAMKVGDRLLVAATLEPVVIKGVGDGRVRCGFALEEAPVTNSMMTNAAQDDSFDVWYRIEDLVLPKAKGEVWEEEMLRVKGQMRTRREVVLLSNGDEVAARRVWEDAKKRSKPGKGSQSDEEEAELNFASCVRGHFLHARCLQGAMLAGRKCPAIGCNEPLCVPRVKRLRTDDTCCGAEGDDAAAALVDEVEGEVDLLRTADDLIRRSRAPPENAARTDRGTGTATDSGGDDDVRMSDAGLPDLKMCPACCSGPLINQNCSDMKAHHGQCSRVAIRGSGGGETSCTPDGAFRVTPVEIAERIKHMSSSQTVADVLPKCPTHGVPVMFNGCLSCGHLFTDTDWDEMPKWDPKAKSLLELDTKKRKAADLLARQVRTEVAMYQFERDQVGDISPHFSLMCKVCSDGDGNNSPADEARLPPLPPPAVKYSRRGCGPSCDLQHFQDGECLVCGRGWGVHSGHTCPGGRTRGSWVVR